MKRFLIVVIFILGMLVANTVAKAGVEVLIPLIKIERQRSKDPTFDGLHLKFSGIKLDNKGCYRVFIETRDLKKAWESKKPIEL